MRVNIWMGVLITILMVSLGVLVQYSKKPLCIDSKIVEKIDRISANGTLSVFRCSLNQPVPYDEVFLARLPELNRRIALVERLFEEISPMRAKVEIVWIENLKQSFRIQEQKIYISDDQLFSGIQFERALMRIWLREKSPTTLIDRTLLEAGLTDFLLYSIGLVDETSLKDSSWPEVVGTEKVESIKPYVGSLKPLFVKTLVEAWNKLSLSERTNVLKEIPNFLSHLSIINGSSLLFEEFEVENVQALKFEIEKVFNLLFKTSAEITPTKSSWNHFQTEIQKAAGLNGLFQKSDTLNLDHIVMVENMNKLTEEDLSRLHFLQKTKLKSAVMDSTWLWIVRAQAALHKELWGTIHTHSLLNISCQSPAVTRLSEFENMAEQVLYIQYCGPIKDLVLKSYLESGASGFARDNPLVSFVHVHIPSLRQALDHKLALGFATPVWDVDIKAYRTNTPIQAIDSFRFLSN